jgi:hypothetical protein
MYVPWANFERGKFPGTRGVSVIGADRAQVGVGLFACFTVGAVLHSQFRDRKGFVVNNCEPGPKQITKQAAPSTMFFAEVLFGHDILRGHRFDQKNIAVFQKNR